MPLKTADNNYSTTRWIVSANYSDGCSHTSLASAYASSNAGDTIVIRDGTYSIGTQAMKAGVNIAAWNGNELTPNVTLIGTLTASFAGSASISGICLQTNSANFLNVSGSSATVINMENCYLNCTNNTGISFSSSSASSQILITNCRGDLGTTSIGLYSSTSAGLILVEKTIMTNSGNSATASTHSAGTVSILYSRLPIPFASSGTGTFGTINFTLIDTSPTNTTSLTHNGSTNCTIASSYLSSGTATCLVIGSGATVQANDIQLRTGNTNAASGAGTLTYTDIQYMGIGKGLSVTTLNRQQVEGGFFRGIQDATTPGTGCLGERFSSNVLTGSAVSVSNASAKTITSITLSAGCWDISAIGCAKGTLTGTDFQVCISTSTNSITGANGDNVARTPTMPTANSDSTLVVPAWRVNIASSTTYFLVMQINYSAGTGTGYGRISAVRVA